jgi:hypothetical protein
MADYSQKAKLYKLNKPLLIFALQLDSNQNVIDGLNQGRLTLFDYELGYIHRWVATSSFDGKQKVGDWEKTGGVHPPNYSLDDADWFKLDTKLILQPGQPVPEGYLPKYKKSNDWQTLKGNGRSQVMIHCDENYRTNPGSYGCIVMQPSEWEDFKKTIKETCGHLADIPYGVIYTF